MILVTGATGTVGGHLVDQLSRSGAPVRALVRSQERADVLRGYDCEIAIGSYDDPQSLHRALGGVTKLFLLSPPSEQMASQELAVLTAVRAAHAAVQVVKLAAIGVDGDVAGARLLEQHRTVVDALVEHGQPHTVLAPNSFMQNFLFWAGSVQEQGAFYAPAGEGEVSHVDARDVAAVAAHVLTSDGHDGATYTVTGPRALTYAEVAEHFSTALGKPVSYVDVPPEGARAAMVDAGFSPWLADGLVELNARYRAGAASVVTDEVHKATGRTPRTVEVFLSDHLAAFR